MAKVEFDQIDPGPSRGFIHADSSTASVNAALSDDGDSIIVLDREFKIEDSAGRLVNHEIVGDGSVRITQSGNTTRWLANNETGFRSAMTLVSTAALTILRLHDRSGDSLPFSRIEFMQGDVLIGQVGFANLAGSQMFVQQDAPSGTLRLRCPADGEVNLGSTPSLGANVVRVRQGALGFFGSFPIAQLPQRQYPSVVSIQEDFQAYGLMGEDAATPVGFGQSFVVTNPTHNIASERLLLLNGAGANADQSIVLPSSPRDFQEHVIKQQSAGSKTITASGTTIDGDASFVMPGVGAAVTFIFASASGEWVKV